MSNMSESLISNASSSQATAVRSSSSNQTSTNRTTRSEIVISEFVQLHKEPNPHLQLKYIVRNSLTGEEIRHATAEFWLEGRDASSESGKLRCLSDFSLVIGDNAQTSEDGADQNKIFSLKFSYAAAVVSGVDEIPKNWPAHVKDSVGRLTAYRVDGKATISLAKLIGSCSTSVLKYLQQYSPSELWKPYNDKKGISAN